LGGTGWEESRNAATAGIIGAAVGFIWKFVDYVDKPTF
jgi:hypothetical protein